jgi:hypothetical protein
MIEYVFSWGEAYAGSRVQPEGKSASTCARGYGTRKLQDLKVPPACITVRKDNDEGGSASTRARGSKRVYRSRKIRRVDARAVNELSRFKSDQHYESHLLGMLVRFTSSAGARQQ